MDRRTILRGAIGGLGATMMPPFVGGNTPDIDVEAARTAELKAAYRLGTAGALADLQDHAYRLRAYMPLLRTERERVRLGRLYADAAQFVGHTFYNAAGYAQAVWWMEQGQDVAEKTGDRPMRVVAYARKSLVRAAEGQAAHAVTLAETGRRIADDPWAEGFAETHLAYAHAKNADPYQALSAMDRAEAAFERAQVDGTPPPFETVEDRLGQLDYHRGKLLVRTDPKRAEPYLAGVLGGLPPERRLRRGGIQVRRADVAASLGEFERAVALAQEGLAVATDGGVTRDVNRVMQLRVRLGTQAPARLVAELDDALRPHREVRGSVLWRSDHR